MERHTSTTYYIWAALLAVEGIGPQTFWKVYQWLAKHEMGWEEFWFAEDALVWERAGLAASQIISLRRFQHTFTPEGYDGWVRERGMEIIHIEHKKYPILLNKIDGKPIILYAKNANIGWNSLPVGVVGTRHNSGYGRVATEHLVSELVAEGAGIISGGMYGIDSIAHHQALSSGGYTVAVLGYGLEQTTSSRNHRSLIEEIVSQGGSVITEYAPWVTASRGTFPQRNRIIAGMTEATVVIEAGVKSGSHITAQWALDYNRVVCAVPGPITNNMSAGTRFLLNQGAVLVGSGREILEEIRGSSTEIVKNTAPSNVARKIEHPDPLVRRIYGELEGCGVTTDEFVQLTGEPIQRVTVALTSLELEGYVRREGSVWYTT